MQFEIAHIHCLNLEDWSHAQYWDIVSLTLSTTRSVAFSTNFSFWLKKKNTTLIFTFTSFYFIVLSFPKAKKKTCYIESKNDDGKKNLCKKKFCLTSA